MIELGASRCDTVVEHSPCHPKVKGSCPAAAGIERERYLVQGTLTEVEGSVQLTSSLTQLVL